MKKILPLFLVFIILGSFLMPFSVNAAQDKQKGNLTSVEQDKQKKGSLTNTEQAPDKLSGGASGTSAYNEFRCIGITDRGQTNYGACIMVAVGEFSHFLTSTLLAVSGKTFDAMLAFSLDRNTLDAQFVKDGWKTVRDLANIAFIFILLYISISTILQLGGTGAKQLLIRVIIIALLVNFSLFISRVVIDTSNILALQFYQAMDAQTTPSSNYNGTVEEKSLSAVFVNGFSPQTIIANNTELNTASGNGLSGTAIFTVFIMASIVNLVTAYALFVAGILFVVRVAALWFLMIAAPFAFIAWILPKTQSQSSKWWSMLFSQSFMAPVFLFLMYIILNMVSGANFLRNTFQESTGTNSDNGGLPGATLESIVLTVMKFIILIVALLMALKITKGMSGEIGQQALNMGKKIGGMAGGFVGGAALGGAGLAGRQLLGRAASTVVKTEGMKNFASNSKFGGMALRGLENVGKSSFDVRATGVTGNTFGKAGGRGGYDSFIKRQVKKRTETAKILGKVENPNLLKEKELEKTKIKDAKNIQKNIKDGKTNESKDVKKKGDKLNIAKENYERKQKESDDLRNSGILDEKKLKEAETAKIEMETAQNELKTAQIIEKNQNEAAQRQIDASTKKIKDIDGSAKERQGNYLDVLDSRSIETGYTKVARKDKEAANAVRGMLNESSSDKKERNILNEIKKLNKDNEIKGSKISYE